MPAVTNGRDEAVARPEIRKRSANTLSRARQLRVALVARDDVENRRADLLVTFGLGVELHREEIGFGEGAALGEQVIDALRPQRPHPHAAHGVGLARR